jgi:CheY-like chemotaxis protein
MSRKILVADDDFDSRFIASEILRHNGFSVLEASNGAEALALAVNQAPALILIDLAMPHMDGLTAARQIREKLGPRLPMLAYTASIRAMDQAAALAAGCDACILKPCLPRDVLATVLRWISINSNGGSHV